jgi:PAS domain S-box-containing protein
VISPGRTTKRAAASVGRSPLDLLDAIPYLCLALDAGGTIVFANEPARAILDSGTGPLTGRKFGDLLPPDSGEAFSAALRRCAAGGAPAGVDVRLPAAGTAGRDVHFSISPHSPGGPGEPPLVIATGRDISAQKLKDLELIRFYNLAHNTVNPLEITDTDGKIIYVNPAFEKASGYSRDELIGKNPNVFSSGKHPGIFWEKMWETIKAGKVWNGEVENRRRNGEPFYAQLLISPILENDGSVVGYLGIHRDITDQKHLEKQLIQAQKMESMGLLTAGIAHEVGNPLTSISSLVQVLERTTDDGFVRDKLELIKSQVDRISRIIRDLVDFSRRSKYEIELTDVNACLREAIAVVSVARKAKTITIESRPGENLPRLALVSDQIQQVLVNVLINAVDAVHDKFGGRPAGDQAGRIEARTRAEGGNLLIEIADNGKGMPESALSKIFEPFFTTKQVGEGSGLGLWVSYGIIKSFQGIIRADSVEGVGTTFTISLPLHTTLA